MTNLDANLTAAEKHNRRWAAAATTPATGWAVDPAPNDGTMPIMVHLSPAERERLCRAAANYCGRDSDVTPDELLHVAGQAFRIGLKQLDTEATGAVRRIIDRHAATTRPEPF